MSSFDDYFELLPEDIKRDVRRTQGARELNNELDFEFMRLKETGEVADKFGCYTLFIKYFFNKDMEEAYLAEAKNFIEHHYYRMGSLHEVLYLSEDYADTFPNTMIRNRILNCMINALEEKDPFTVEMFIRLYKKYYKKEYNQLKRYSMVKDRDLIELSRPNEDVQEMTIIIS